MHAKIIVTGITAAEKTAKEILEHVEAIRNLQKNATWPGVNVEVEIKTEADSCSCRPLMG